MRSSRLKPSVQISVPFLCALILFLIWDPTGLGDQMVLAAVLHEAGHLLAMACLGKRPQRIVFGGFGVRIETPPGVQVAYGKEALIYAAGPVVNLLLAAAFSACPAVWRTHLVLGLFNLLPMGVLDGGQILRCVLQQRMEMDRADFWMKACSFFCGVIMACGAAAVWLTSGYNFSLLITTGYLFSLLFAGNSEV